MENTNQKESENKPDNGIFQQWYTHVILLVLMIWLIWVFT